MLWLGEMVDLICNFYVSVAAHVCCLSRSVPVIHFACCWDVRQPPPQNKQTNKKTTQTNKNKTKQNQKKKKTQQTRQFKSDIFWFSLSWISFFSHCHFLSIQWLLGHLHLSALDVLRWFSVSTNLSWCTCVILGSMVTILREGEREREKEREEQKK